MSESFGAGLTLSDLEAHFGIHILGSGSIEGENQTEDNIPRTCGSAVILNMFLGWSFNSWLLSPMVQHIAVANASRYRNSADCTWKYKVAHYLTVLSKTLQSNLE